MAGTSLPMLWQIIQDDIQKNGQGCVLAQEAKLANRGSMASWFLLLMAIGATVEKHITDKLKSKGTNGAAATNGAAGAKASDSDIIHAARDSVRAIMMIRGLPHAWSSTCQA